MAAVQDVDQIFDYSNLIVMISNDNIDRYYTLLQIQLQELLTYTYFEIPKYEKKHYFADVSSDIKLFNAYYDWEENKGDNIVYEG